MRWVLSATERASSFKDWGSKWNSTATQVLREKNNLSGCISQSQTPWSNLLIVYSKWTPKAKRMGYDISACLTFKAIGGLFPAFNFIILKSPRMQSDTHSWLISKPLISFSFEENIMDGSKQGIIGQTHGSAWPANNPDRLPRLAASLGNIVH